MNFVNSNILFVKSVDVTEINNNNKRQPHGKLRFGVIEYQLNNSNKCYQIILYKAKQAKYLLKMEIKTNFEIEVKDCKSIEFTDSTKNTWIIEFRNDKDIQDFHKIADSLPIKIQNSINSILSDWNLSDVNDDCDIKHLSLEVNKIPSSNRSPIIFQHNLDTSSNQNNEYFRTLLNENRNQNSELRFMITNLANKIDLLTNRMDRNNLKYSDVQIDEIFSKLKQENSELKNQLQNIEIKSKQEIEQLKTEKNKLRKSEQKLKEILNEQKTKAHENELLQLQNQELNEQNNNLNEKVTVLEETIYQQKVRISDLETQESYLKNYQGICSDQLNKCHDHVKRLMDTCFREIRHNYQAKHIYNGGDIISAIAPKIVKTTYDIIHSIDSELDSCIKDSNSG